MILVKLRGGLSNQMFQYAAARRLAAVHSTSVRIDTSWYDNIPAGATLRTYELHHLQITGERASRWETIGTDGVRSTRVPDLPIALYRRLRPRYRFVAERYFHFDPSVLALPDNACLFGYWVSERYFVDAAEIIRREFRFRNPPSLENQKWMARMAEAQSVAIHLRRGDYAADPAVTASHGLCGVDYYRRCVELVRQHVVEPYFFVFSDDLNWARENLGLGTDAEYVDHNQGAPSHEDLRLMSCARHNIIANSSYSWWAAWLNQHESKLVVAPERWMSNPSFDSRDVLPMGWFQV